MTKAHDFFALIACVLPAVMLLSCVGSYEGDLQLTEQGKYLGVGDSLRLGYVEVGSEGQQSLAVWTSSDDAVATVDASGLVVAQSEGEATITLQMGKSSADCFIRVTTYSFDDAAFFADTLTGRHTLLLADAATTNGGGPIFLQLQLMIPSDADDIAGIYYPADGSSAGDTRVFLTGCDDGGNSYLIDLSSQDTLFVNGGQFEIISGETHFISGELVAGKGETRSFSFFYEGALPLKNSPEPTDGIPY